MLTSPTIRPRTTRQFAPKRVGTVEGNSLAEAVRNFERRLIEQALLEVAGDCPKASKLLNIIRSTLVDKMKRFGLRTTD